MIYDDYVMLDFSSFSDRDTECLSDPYQVPASNIPFKVNSDYVELAYGSNLFLEKILTDFLECQDTDPNSVIETIVDELSAYCASTDGIFLFAGNVGDSPEIVSNFFCNLNLYNRYVIFYVMGEEEYKCLRMNGVAYHNSHLDCFHLYKKKIKSSALILNNEVIFVYARGEKWICSYKLRELSKMTEKQINNLFVNAIIVILGSTNLKGDEEFFKLYHLLAKVSPEQLIVVLTHYHIDSAFFEIVPSWLYINGEDRDTQEDHIYSYPDMARAIIQDANYGMSSLRLPFRQTIHYEELKPGNYIFNSSQVGWQLFYKTKALELYGKDPITLIMGNNYYFYFREMEDGKGVYLDAYGRECLVSYSDKNSLIDSLAIAKRRLIHAMEPFINQLKQLKTYLAYYFKDAYVVEPFISVSTSKSLWATIMIKPDGNFLFLQEKANHTFRLFKSFRTMLKEIDVPEDKIRIMEASCPLQLRTLFYEGETKTIACQKGDISECDICYGYTTKKLIRIFHNYMESATSKGIFFYRSALIGDYPGESITLNDLIEMEKQRPKHKRRKSAKDVTKEELDAKSKKKRLLKARENILALSDNTVLLVEYNGSRKKSIYKCIICGNVWSERPDHFSDYHLCRCPLCHGMERAPDISQSKY